MLIIRRAVRAVEGARLEIVYTYNRVSWVQIPCSPPGTRRGTSDAL